MLLELLWLLVVLVSMSSSVSLGRSGSSLNLGLNTCAETGSQGQGED